MKVANWLANEVVVKRLAESKAFQSFALRTHYNVEAVREAGKQAVEKAADGGKEGVKKVGMRPPPKGGVLGFLSAFGKEVRKDLKI